MKWFDYKQEVDSLHASDALKAQLLAMAEQADAAAPAENASAANETSARSSRPATAKKHKPIRFPWKALAGMAACFLVGIFSCDAFGWQVIPRMGNSYNMAAEYSADSFSASAMADTSTGTSYDSAKTQSANGDMGDSGKLLAAPSNGARAARKVIYNTSLTLESKEYDDTRAALDAAAAAAGGYAESRSESNYDYEVGGARSCSIIYRIPVDQYAAFLAAADGAGSVTSSSETADDVTAQYVDVEARISALTAQRDRLLELEAQADDLDALLQIENSLSDVQYQLESYQSQMNCLNDQIDYCTVSIELEEVEVYTPVEETGFLAKLGKAFANGLRGFTDGLGNFVLTLAGAWPVLVLIALVCGGVVWFRKRRLQKK